MENKDLTPEEILKVQVEEYAKCKVEYNLTEPGIIKAMQEYAKQESRKAAEKAINGRVRRLGRCIR